MAEGSGFGSLLHLAGRFFGSLFGRRPSAGEEAWVAELLSEAELALWRSMSKVDRSHAILVARRADVLLKEAGRDPDGEVLAAALLHDVGKSLVRVGTWGRVAITLAALALGRKRLLRLVASGDGFGLVGGAGPGGFAPLKGIRRKVAGYICHDWIGGQLLRAAGSSELVFWWAEDHHKPPGRWRLPAEVASALKAADGD